MKIIGIEHIGIASDDLSKANKFWNLVLGINKTSLKRLLKKYDITNYFTKEEL